MQITLNIPDQLIQQQHSLNSADWMREIANDFVARSAIALFQQELITLGTASKIAGMHQMEFQALLSDRGICIHYDLADYQADIESLRDHNWR
jgi:predicted HTH domain antitoxin